MGKFHMIHTLRIPITGRMFRLALEHIRYSDSRVRDTELNPSDVDPQWITIKLEYIGSRKRWKVVAERAESIGLKIW